MRIQFRNVPESVRKKLPYYRAAAQYFFERAMRGKEDIYAEYPVEIKWDGTRMDDPDAVAEMSPTRNNSKGVVLIRFHKQKRILLEILAHEMIHHAQERRGDYMKDATITRWKKRNYLNRVLDNISYEDYLNLPWEKEAYKYESIYVNDWIENNG